MGSFNVYEAIMPLFLPDEVKMSGSDKENKVEGNILFRSSERWRKTPLGKVLRELPYLAGEDRDDFLLDLANENGEFARRWHECLKGFENCEDCRKILCWEVESNSESGGCP